MQVSKWGNSLAVRLPAKLVEELGLKEGDDVELVRKAPGVLEVERLPSIDELFERVRTMSRKLPANFKFDREEANKRRHED
jgi:antitoxin MazE